jgi:hypothetical protein
MLITWIGLQWILSYNSETVKDFEIDLNSYEILEFYLIQRLTTTIRDQMTCLTSGMLQHRLHPLPWPR